MRHFHKWHQDPTRSHLYHLNTFQDDIRIGKKLRKCGKMHEIMFGLYLNIVVLYKWKLPREMRHLRAIM